VSDTLPGTFSNGDWMLPRRLNRNSAEAMSHASTIYPERIVRDPQILVGKPVVRGTRIAVEVVLDYLAQNPRFSELFADYPRLTIEDVQACLEYAQGLVAAEGRQPEASCMA
jgi:uncharacterized protein (DUF433 family)